jgi:hypothetical protein
MALSMATKFREVGLAIFAEIGYLRHTKPIFSALGAGLPGSLRRASMCHKEGFP